MPRCCCRKDLVGSLAWVFAGWKKGEVSQRANVIVASHLTPQLPESVASDGATYRVELDGRAVLQRSVHDVDPTASALAIRRVGVVCNWEWGHDTGSRFLSFTAASR